MMKKHKHSDPTRLIRGKATRKIEPSKEGKEASDSKATELVKEEKISAPAKDLGQKTRIFRGSKLESKAQISVDKSSSDTQSPVTGWVVILEGQGRGNSIALGYGQQKIGRSKESDIRLDFGDLEISREKHAGIVYDAKGRKFYLQPGDGVNLTYLNDAPVLSPVELSPDSEIQVGATKLRFIPLCGPDFEWHDV